MSRNGNWCADLPDNKRLYCDYGFLNVVDEQLTANSPLKKFEPFRLRHGFKVSAQGTSLQAVNVAENDWPLTIRSPMPGDEIVLRLGTKKLNRWFIDRKNHIKNVKCWPVVVNRRGKVILVPEIGCEVAHFTNKPECICDKNRTYTFRGGVLVCIRI